jgi:hypothetical protein
MGVGIMQDIVSEVSTSIPPPFQTSYTGNLYRGKKPRFANMEFAPLLTWRARLTAVLVCHGAALCQAVRGCGQQKLFFYACHLVLFIHHKLVSKNSGLFFMGGSESYILSRTAPRF